MHDISDEMRGDGGLQSGAQCQEPGGGLYDGAACQSLRVVAAGLRSVTAHGGDKPMMAACVVAVAGWFRKARKRGTHESSWPYGCRRRCLAWVRDSWCWWWRWRGVDRVRLINCLRKGGLGCFFFSVCMVLFWYNGPALISL
jgi:hypothetical protein